MLIKAKNLGGGTYKVITPVEHNIIELIYKKKEVSNKQISIKNKPYIKEITNRVLLAIA